MSVWLIEFRYRIVVFVIDDFQIVYKTLNYTYQNSWSV